ncbi:MAG: glycogen/starch synthase [Muribaculaceae bacterium]|nr:glycogen/starch synthase [Muribaculaceae bacterium]
MADKKILFVSQEIAPYLQTGEPSDLGRLLPQSMPSKKFEVRTFMPKFGNINERRNQLHEVIRLSGLNIEINDNDHPLIIKVASMQPSRIQVYFIDNDDYFQKLDSDENDYGFNRDDNDERTIFFARGTIETVKKLKWAPDIIQCTGLITALTPVYVRNMYAQEPEFANSRIIYTVMPGEITGKIDDGFIEKLKTDGVHNDTLDILKNNRLDTNIFHKLAINAADAVIFHTETPDPELLEFTKQRNIPVATLQQLGNDPKLYIDFYDRLSSADKTDNKK